MNTCDTCKWWGKKDSSIYPLRYCENADWSANYDKKDGICNVHGEPYNEGSIATGPKFGCIHHVTKA